MFIKYIAAVPLSVICDVAQNWDCHQADFKLQFWTLYLQLLQHVKKKDVTSQFKSKKYPSGTVWPMTKKSQTNLRLLYLHGGKSFFACQILLVMSHKGRPGCFAGQQHEFAVAVIHKVENGVISCLACILQNTLIFFNTWLNKEILYFPTLLPNKVPLQGHLVQQSYTM